MSLNKQRLTVTVDQELVDAAQRAVASGAAESVSSWVSTAIADKAERDHKLQLLAAAVADFEAEFGEITTDEIAAHRSGGATGRTRGRSAW